MAETLWDDLEQYNRDLRLMLSKPMNHEAHDVVRGTVRNLAEMLKRWAGTAEGRSLPEPPATESRPTPLVLYPDLLSAVERACGKAKEGRERWSEPENRDIRASYHSAAVALELLARELTPERDGAGALPVQPPEPVAATSTPAPSRPPICGAPYVFSGHPGIVCRKDQGHPEEEAHHDWTHDWEVWWK